MNGKELALADQVQAMSMNNQQLAAVAQQMGKLIISLDARMAAVEKLLTQRVTVSSLQAKTVCGAVQAQARALCEKYELPYKQCGEAFRRAIWRDFKAQHNVSDVHDLPASYYDIALEFVGAWNSFALVRRQREKCGA